MKDPNKFKDMFGTEAVRLIKHQPSSSDELLVEYYDDPDATWLRPVDGGVVETNFSDTIQFESVEDLREREREGRWRDSALRNYEWNPSRRENLGPKDKLSDSSWLHYYPEDYQKGQEGISAAALHLLKEDGEPPQVKKLNPDAIDDYRDPFPSWWDKALATVKDTLSPDEDHYPDIGALELPYTRK